MKIAIIVPGGVDRSGVDRVIPSLLWLIERLARRHEVHVFALRQETQPSDWELLGAQVHNIGTTSGAKRRLRARFAAIHRADRRPFDVVHAFFDWCGTAAAAIGWLYRIPVAFHASGGEFVAARDIDYGMLITQRGRIAARVAVAGARRLTVASQPMQALARSFGAHAERVPLGVALDRWPSRAPRERKPGSTVRLLHVGDIRPVKDQQMLMNAAALLRDAGVDFTLDVAGLDRMSGAIQRTPAAQCVAPVTRWHGVVQRDALRHLMEAADILVVTSRHEAGPLVVLEAAVAGVPPVGTAVGHVAEWASDAAVSVPVGDASALGREIASLAGDEPRRLRIAREAQRRAVAIDADFTASTFEKMYEQMCSAR